MRRHLYKCWNPYTQDTCSDSQKVYSRDDHAGENILLYILLGILTAVFCYIFCFRYGMFGSKVDWISQHSVLPDYFRQQFYETGELFPEFAANIGGGQNIYNFAYYGLYNPVLMLSYLFPSVKMSDYMMAVQFLGLLASVLLMYAWLGKRGFPQMIRVGVTVMFLLSGPMIYHSYSQIMFVNYMPFLIMGLWGVDRYFTCRGISGGDAGGLILPQDRKIRVCRQDRKLYVCRQDRKLCVCRQDRKIRVCRQDRKLHVCRENRKLQVRRQERKCGRRPGVWLTVSIVLMILTSFYFSIGGMLVLVLYGIHRFLAVCDGEGAKVTPGRFAAEGVRFAFPFILAVMMSGILLVPTASALTGREGKSAGVGLAELLIPTMPASRFCYSTHGIGLTTLALTALIALMFGKKLYDRVLAWGCMAVLTVPVFAYLLNGGLYVRDKAMIPFLPLLCYVLACYLEDKQDRGRKWFLVMEILPYVLTVVLIYICRRQGEAGKYWKLLLLDSIVMLVCFVGFICCRVWLDGRTTDAPERPQTHFHGLHILPCRQAGSKAGQCRIAAALMLPGIVMLIIFGNGCHAQGAHAVKREFYQRVTDSHIRELIAKTVEAENGFYRMEQLGDDEENAANLNRIWNMGQYISSIYSSSYYEGYREFRDDTFCLEEPFRNFLMQSAVHNPVYQRFMGVKYVVSEEEVPGYEEVTGYEERPGGREVPGNEEKPEDAEVTGDGEEPEDTEVTGDGEEPEDTELPGYMPGDDGAGSREGLRVYRNDRVSPIAYATDRVITEKLYKELEFPYNQLALLRYAVIEDENAGAKELKGGNDLRETLTKVAEPVDIQLPEKVESKKDQTIHLNLPDPQEEKQGERVLFLKFRVENLRSSKDVTVRVEGIRNKLTAANHFYYNDNTEFAYAVPLKAGQKSVEMRLGKGCYRLADAEAYLGVLSDENNTVEEDSELKQENAKAGEDSGLYQSELRIDRNRTKGNCIAGTIDVKQLGYFVTTITYDEHFEIRVDDQEVEGEEVNTAFLGFEIGSGEHEIEILYHAPGVTAGRILSAAGVLLFVLIGLFRHMQRMCD